MHVGLVLPGFIATEGFPQSELTAKPWTRWIVSTPEHAAEAIYEAGLGRRPERYVPRPYWLAAALRDRRARRSSAACSAAARRRGDDDDHRRRHGRAGAAARPRRRALASPAGVADASDAPREDPPSGRVPLPPAERGNVGGEPS